MTVNEKRYAVGDWIVHARYGVGQVRSLEKKPIGDIDRLCYRVRTENGVFWLPIDNDDNKRVRPIASPRRIQRAIETLRKAPQKMAAKFQTRRKRIREVSLDGDLNSDIKLLRDLNARQHRRGLNMTEQNAFDAIAKRFSKEWSLSNGIDIKEAHQKLNHFLRESWKKVKERKGEIL